MHIRTRLTALLAALALPASACSAPARLPETARPDERALRVVTFNVNFGLAGDPVTRRAVFEHDADVIVLQETTPRWEFELRSDPAIGGYPHLHFTHSRGAGGQAILSRLPLVSVDVMAPPDDGWFPALRAVVDVGGHDVQLLGLHLRPPVSDTGSYVSGYWNADRIHGSEIETYWQGLEADMPTIVLGDFNESASGAAIEWLEGKGLQNALPQFDPGAHTWRWKTWIGRITHDLDHVLHDARLRLLDAKVVERGRSDHLPVVVDLALAARR